MAAKEFLNKLEIELKNLSGDKVVDVGNIPIDSANFLKHIYGGVYNVFGPEEDVNNLGKYVVAFSLPIRRDFKNA